MLAKYAKPQLGLGLLPMCVHLVTFTTHLYIPAILSLGWDNTWLLQEAGRTLTLSSYFTHSPVYCTQILNLISQPLGLEEGE